MAMNFAPYQDSNPETERALSPPPPSDGRRSATTSPRPQSPYRPRNINQWGAPQESLPEPGDFENNAGLHGAAQTGAPGRGGFGNGVGAEERNPMELFGTSLPMRLDYEACLAYLLLPPAGGVFLLMAEHKSDYVRYHAWQSSLLFTFLFIVHLIFSFSSVVSYILLVIDLTLILFLTNHAHRDAQTLDRYQLPLVGPLANSFVDDE